VNTGDANSARRSSTLNGLRTFASPKLPAHLHVPHGVCLNAEACVVLNSDLKHAAQETEQLLHGPRCFALLYSASLKAMTWRRVERHGN
jgi:hypothetical protein